MQKVLITIDERPLSKENEKFWNKHVGRPFTSKKFKDYEERVRITARKQMYDGKWSMFQIPVFCYIKFYFKSDIRYDLLNAPKSVLDALQGIVYTNDKLIERAFLEIMGNTPKERIEIEIWAIDDSQMNFLKG